jgi:hypothetical protein
MQPSVMFGLSKESPDPSPTGTSLQTHGVRPVPVICRETSCGHFGSINVDNLPDDFAVPDVSLRLRCSACGSRNVKTQPIGKTADGIALTGNGAGEVERV